MGIAPPISSDPPFHHDARRLLLPAFSPKAIAPLEPFTRNYCDELLANPRVLNRRHELDPVVEIARHQVGRADVDALGLAVALERVHARVLEEAADDRDDLDVLRDAGHTGTQSADPAHVDLHLDPGLRGAVELASSSEFIFIRIRAGVSGECASIVRSISSRIPL